MQGVKKGALGLFIVFLGFTLVGCSGNDLSRGHAEKLISEAMPLLTEPVHTHIFPGGKLAGEWDSCRFESFTRDENEDQAFQHLLEKSGHITVRKEVVKGFVAPFTYGDKLITLCEFTEKGKKELVWKTEEGHWGGTFFLIKLAERKVDEVNGVRLEGDGRKALATFTYQIVPNIAGDLYRSRSQQHGEPLSTQFIERAGLVTDQQLGGRAVLALYDDGWRVESINLDGK